MGKKLVVIRGVPGAGKSQTAKKYGGLVLSTDDYFYSQVEPDQPEKYSFTPSLLGKAHEWNYLRALDAMRKGVTPIVIDNTNITPWEPKKYVEAGVKYGYDVEIKEPDSPWWPEISSLLNDKIKNKAELEKKAEMLAKRNIHGVPANVIMNMFNKWHSNMTFQDILK